VEPAEAFNIELLEIQDLCTTLTNCHRKVCAIGFLNSTDYRHEFYSRPSSSHFSGRSSTLSKLLSCRTHTNQCQTVHQRRKLSRKARKELSVHIATSLLQLYPTPWISEDWTRADIVLDNLDEMHPESAVLPYLRRMFSTGTEIPSIATAKNTQAILFQLGVLLLELCVGEALEDRYTGSGGDQRELFEVVHGWWAKEAKNEEGEEVAEVIRKCLCFEFTTERKTLHNEEFQRVIFNEVVTPLREALDKMFGKL
jgi:hypothetical protein